MDIEAARGIGSATCDGSRLVEQAQGGRPAAGARPDGHGLVLATLRDHAASLLRTARRYSLSAADAEDAYQRALEIFVRRADSLDPEGAPAWLRTVVKHEALAVRRDRGRLVPTDTADLDLREAEGAPTTEERIERFDRLTRAAEALERLKPQELRALLLKAEGHSYGEICELTGWTYTKVKCRVRQDAPDAQDLAHATPG